MPTVLSYTNAFPGAAFPQHGGGSLTTTVQSYIYPGAVQPNATGTVLTPSNAFPNGAFPQSGGGSLTTTVQSYLNPGAVQPAVSSGATSPVEGWRGDLSVVLTQAFAASLQQFAPFIPYTAPAASNTIPGGARLDVDPLPPGLRLSVALSALSGFVPFIAPVASTVVEGWRQSLDGPLRSARALPPSDSTPFFAPALFEGWRQNFDTPTRLLSAALLEKAQNDPFAPPTVTPNSLGFFWGQDYSPEALSKPIPAAIQPFQVTRLGQIETANTPQGWQGQQYEYRFQAAVAASLQQLSGYVPMVVAPSPPPPPPAPPVVTGGGGRRKPIRPIWDIAREAERQAADNSDPSSSPVVETVDLPEFPWRPAQTVKPSVKSADFPWPAWSQIAPALRQAGTIAPRKAPKRRTLAQADLAEANDATVDVAPAIGRQIAPTFESDDATVPSIRGTLKVHEEHDAVAFTHSLLNRADILIREEHDLLHATARRDNDEDDALALLLGD